MVAMTETHETATGEHGHTPERTCVVSRVRLSPEDLVRFVRDPQGVIVPDVAGKLPGRGVWVACRRQSVEEAARRNAFAKSLKGQAKVPDGLADLVEELLKRRAAGALGLAKKAGQVVAGFTKVEKAVEKGEAIALIRASDAAEDGAGKLERKLRLILADLGRKTEDRFVSELSSVELSLAMGRLHVVHAALSKGGAAESFLREAARLRRYRTDWDVEAARPQATGSDTEQA